MNFFFRLLAIPLAIIVLTACDSVNTDQAEKSTIDQYQRTNSGTFPAQVHVQNYWNSEQSISCTKENPTTISFYNLNPPGVKGYYFDTNKDISTSNLNWIGLTPVKVGEEHQVTGWTVPGSIDNLYTLHVWLKNSFGKAVYAGETEIYYDTTPPIFSSVFSSSSKTPTLSLSIQDLTLAPSSITVVTGTHSLGDPGIPCSGIIQLSENNFTSCIPFSGQPEFEKDDSDLFMNRIKIQAPELPESTEFSIKIEGGISDCPGNVSNVSQIKSFVTGDTGPPFIISASLSSNNSYNTSFSKPGDTITLKFIANERLSETGGVDAVGANHPKNSPKVDFWVNDNTSYQTVDAIKDTSDLSGRTWIASLLIQNSQAPWNDNTSAAGDNISYKIYEYWDLAKDANLNFVPNLGSDNYTSTTDGSYLIYDNVLPTLKSPLKLVTTNANFSNMFKVGETAYIDFEVNDEDIYNPQVDIGGFDNTTITGGPRLWKAEYTYNDNSTPDNDSVSARINIIDKVGNINTYNSDNTVVFDKTIKSLNPVTIISDNTVRNIVQGGQIHHYAKLNDNVSLEFQSDETIIIHYVTIGIDNVSQNLILPQDSDNKSWKVKFPLNNSSLQDGDLYFAIHFTDLVSNDNYTADLTTNGSKVIYDNTPPVLDNVTIKSNNSNNWMAKKNDTVTLQIIASENLKNTALQCYSGSFTSTTSSSCIDSKIYLFGDDNNTTQVTPNQITGTNFRQYTMSRVFSTASPITSQAGDNVTFSIEFEDYAGNKGVLVNSTTDNTTVTYDDQNPILSPIKIISDNTNSSSESPDKRLAKPGDNVTLTFSTPENLDDMVLNFANNTVVPTLAGQDYTFVKMMDTSDTSKNFNGCTNTTTITGCQIPFQMTATDFAGNQSTHNQDDTTDNSSVKFDGVEPDLSPVNFKTDNCNERAGKVNDNQTLSVTSTEPLLESSVMVHFFTDNGTHQDNFTSNNSSDLISISFTGTSGDLVSKNKFAAKRMFKNTDVEGAIKFYTSFTDPAGNFNENLNTTTDTSSVTFDRTIPVLTNISISTDNDPGFDNQSMPGTLINVNFIANEELRALNNNYCTNSCCINPYVVRKYCDNSSITCTDTVSTDITKNSYADQEHGVNSNHTDWINGFRHYSSDTTSLDGDVFRFEIHYLDWAGNPGVIRYLPDDNKTIIYDDVRPQLSEVLIESNNWNTDVKYVAKTGDNLTLTYTLPNNLRVKPTTVGLAQRSSTTYNQVPTNLISGTTNRFNAVYTMTDNDLEGRVDFEIKFKDLAGNEEIVRMDRKLTNNCNWPSNVLINPTVSRCPNNGSSWANDNTTHYRINEIGTTDDSFVVFDRTPPSIIITPTGSEKSVIDETIKLRFHDLTGLLKKIDTVNGFTGFDNFSGGSNYNSNSARTDNMSQSYCGTPIELTDNRSFFSDCYPILRVGRSDGNPTDNRTTTLENIDFHFNASSHIDPPRNYTSDAYRQSFEIIRYNLQPEECPVRPSTGCEANLFPDSTFLVKLRTPVSDLAGNVLNPTSIGGDTTESFETYKRPFVSAHTPQDQDEGVSVNENPFIRFNIPNQQNIETYKALNESFDKNYTSSDPDDTKKGQVSLDYRCLTSDNNSSGQKGAISMDPQPKGGFDLGYYENDVFSGVTIRPAGTLEMGTTYTVTVNNDVDPGPSFCRQVEKIVPLNRYQFSFKTVDNVTRGLIAHYPLNNNVLDHSNIDGEWNDGTPSNLNSIAGKDSETNGAYSFNGSSSEIKISDHSNINFSDNFGNYRHRGLALYAAPK